MSDPNQGLFGPRIADIWGTNTRRRMKRQREADESDDPVMANLQRLHNKRAGVGGSAAAGGRRGHQPRKLPIEVAALLGEAHADVISGREERAISILGEVVRRSPEAPEAYSTLSAVYEARSAEEDVSTNLERAQQLALVAAHLAPQDASAWRRVAMLSLELATRANEREGSASYEQSALEALSRVLKLEPRDAAAAADRAALRSASGDVDAAVDELVAFTSAGKQPGEVASVDDVSLKLVLAENALAAGRRDVARTALELAVSDASHALANATSAEIDVDPIEMLQSRDRASLELAKLNYDDGRWNDALTAVEGAGQGREGDEPLDLAVMRGACNARLGRFNVAFDCWRSLVASSRQLALSYITEPDDKDTLLADHAAMIETCVDASADAPADFEVAALAVLDALAKLHRAGGHACDEARAHARAARLLRSHGKLRVANHRVDRALRASRSQPLALAELAELAVTDATEIQERVSAVATAFEVLDRRALDDQPVADDGDRADEVTAWCALGRALAQKLRFFVASRHGDRERHATRLLAIGLAAARASFSAAADTSMTAPLGKAAVDVAFLVRGRTPFARAATSLHAKGADIAVERRLLRLMLTSQGADKQRRAVSAMSYEWCVQALLVVDDIEAACDALSDVAIVCDLAASIAPLSRSDVGSIASRFCIELTTQVIDRSRDDVDAVCELATALASLAAAPYDDRPAANLSRTMRQVQRRPASGRLARQALRLVELAVLETRPALSPSFGVLAASFDPDPRSARTRLPRPPGTATHSLMRAAVLADAAAAKPPSKSSGIENRHGLVLAAAAHFDDYATRRIRTDPRPASVSPPSLLALGAEVAYNRARFYHSLGLYGLAEPHYRTVLDHPSPSSTIRRLAAHNLLVLLSESGTLHDEPTSVILSKHLSVTATSH